MSLNVLKQQISCKAMSIRRSSSIISEKVKHFNNISTNWWNPEGSMKHLHLFHPHQISFIRQQLRLKNGIKPEANLHQPLTGNKIADVGCGVGMNSEGLAILGAEVTGLDPGNMLIHEAKVHAACNFNLEGKLTYLVSTAEEHRLTHSGQYDAVIAFFILEHIQDRQEFIDNCLALLKPNGSLFTGHCNRSFLWYSSLLWHKYVTGLVGKCLRMPYGTLLTHEEIIAMVNKGHPCELKGRFNVILTLNGQSCREAKSQHSCIFSCFVKNN